MNSNDNKRAGAEFERLAGIVAELRGKCPWDREQKLADTPRHLIEETYEAADAIARGNQPEIADELGDVITQALFAAVIAGEAGGLSIAQILAGAADKLIRRHPHIYAGVKADSVEKVLENWDAIKAQEKKRSRENPLADTGHALPALMRAEKLGEKSRRLGMDWADLREVLAKAREELDEIEEAIARGDAEAAAGEIGDLMLAVANAPRFLNRDAESTLRAACDKFIDRFGRVAELAQARGVDMKSLSSAQIDSLWKEAKQRG